MAVFENLDGVLHPSIWTKHCPLQRSDQARESDVSTTTQSRCSKVVLFASGLGARHKLPSVHPNRPLVGLRSTALPALLTTRDAYDV